MALSQRRRRRFRNEADKKREAECRDQETPAIDATQQRDANPPEPIGGRGAYVASGLLAVEDARLEAQAIQGGWAGSVFPIESKWQELQKKVLDAGGPTLTQHLTLSVHKALESPLPILQAIAIRSGVSMVALNQKETHHQSNNAPKKVESSVSG